MAWLIAVVVFLIPLIFFPRVAVYILLAAVLLLGGWAFYESVDNSWTLAEGEKVTISIGFDPATCPATTPVLARVNNASKWAVRTVTFDIAVKRRGYSNEIGRLSRLLDDEAMPPGGLSHYCYALPVLIPPVKPEELEFTVPVKFVTFQ